MRPSLSVVKQRIDHYISGRVDDVDDRAEVAQLCLIKVWRKGHTFRGDSAFDSWLYTVIRYEVVNWSRQEARHARIVDCAARFERPQQDLEHEVLDRVAVQRLLLQLSGLDRKIVELHYLRDLTSERVGETTGLAPSSVRCRLLRVRRAFQFASSGRGHASVESQEATTLSHALSRGG